jgi:hypothetical protein
MKGDHENHATRELQATKLARNEMSVKRTNSGEPARPLVEYDFKSSWFTNDGPQKCDDTLSNLERARF